MDHYQGTAETSRRAAEADAQLMRLHYKSEASFPFEKYITRLHECFEALEDNKQGLLYAQKVKKMLENVTTSNMEVISLKTVIRERYPNDFAQASTHMAGQIALIFSAAQRDSQQTSDRGCRFSRSWGWSWWSRTRPPHHNVEWR